MRYLWVEDFDGGKSGQKEIKSKLEKYFQLEKRNINICTLEQALIFLDDPLNWRKFDAVLIDIRFKVCEKEQDECSIYEKYFASFLTKDSYENYTKKIGGDANAASSGVLLYLALIHKYNYNQNRIAFISANVDDTSGELADINNMKEFISMAKYVRLEDKDIQAFTLLNENVFNMYMEKMKLNQEEANKKFPLPETDSIDWGKIDDLEKRINIIEKELKEAIGKGSVSPKSELKYNSIREEFEKVGLKVPIAFEKPGGEYPSYISWKFKTWVEETLNTDYYKLRSNILPICIEIQNVIAEESALEIDQPNRKMCLYQPYKKMCMDKENAKNEENVKNEIIELFSDIMVLFPGNRWIEKDEWLYFKAIKESVRLCDNMKKPVRNETSMSGCECIEDSYEYACRAVLKLARNWTSHQGIKNISAYDVVFFFHILVDTFLDINKYPKLKEYDQILIKALCHDEVRMQYQKVMEIVKKEEKKYRKKHKEACEASGKKGKEGYKYDDESPLYDTISGIGHKFSPIRKEVSIKHLYVLFLSSLDEIYFNKDNIFVYSVINELVQCIKNET